jgi:hypothetical protein
MTNPNHPNVDQSDRVVPINLRQSGRTPTELLISTRVRKSPFWHLSHEAGCWRATVYNRIYHPRGYVRPEDGGAMIEYEALVNRVTMWNVAVERQIRVKFHEDPIDIAHGKHADDFPELPSPLTPLGPSDIFIFGIPSLSILLVCQASNPLNKSTFSSRVKSSIN